MPPRTRTSTLYSLFRPRPLPASAVTPSMRALGDSLHRLYLHTQVLTDHVLTIQPRLRLLLIARGFRPAHMDGVIEELQILRVHVRGEIVELEHILTKAWDAFTELTVEFGEGSISAGEAGAGAGAAPGEGQREGLVAKRRLLGVLRECGCRIAETQAVAERFSERVDTFLEVFRHVRETRGVVLNQPRQG